MATVFIPTLLQSYTSGTKLVTVKAHNIRQLLDHLEGMYPGIKEGLLEDGEILPNISIAIDGDISQLGLLEQLEDDTEVHFIPAIAGGSLEVRVQDAGRWQ